MLHHVHGMLIGLAERKNGYHVWLYGERYWHRSRAAAIARARAATYCSSAQVIEIATVAEVRR